ncbi:diguanylate cyclase/phosphodiesterase with PAS/PAC sensor(s) [Pseudonocardia oroxyli]|uniref:Diguanylate cyclase/phosphodiesterase with PAS/PAC sensor(S) n=1 Tax=Pseudonocardia oroxyli TaxID=366584 RepID=A0A1G7UK07_PSEOR|nr:diguanylate cyclase/phosphodiesterase with PAS/PAC sensor(s) [Pseudonocardia oroxyli]
MVAASDLPGRPVRLVGLGERAGPEVRSLAQRWIELLPNATVTDAGVLAGLLLRLRSALRTEPFWPLAARGIGADLAASGFCGDRAGIVGSAPEDVLPGSIRLLREAAPGALDLTVQERHRLVPALDEFAAGFAGGLRFRAHQAQEDLLRSTLRARREVERELAESEAHYRTIYTQGPVGIAVATLDGELVDLNPAGVRMLGMVERPALPAPVSDFVHPDDLESFLAAYGRLASGTAETVSLDIRFAGPTRMWVWGHVTGSLVRDDSGRPSHLIGVIEDVSERYRLRSSLVEASSRDRLTGLPNRHLTEVAVRQAFGGSALRVGLCALDIDEFRRVNEMHGHAVGDELLAALADRLRTAAGPHLLTRTGGDEFAVVLTDPEGVGEVLAVADRLLAALAAPFHLGGAWIAVTASVGVAEALTSTECPAELLRAAGVALTWAKGQGGGTRAVFDPERDAGEAARFALLANLRGAVDRDQFRLVYQPLVRLSDTTLRGMEALVRWEHPEHGLLGPGRFIELAERSGAIVQLGRWVLTEACREAARWQAELGRDAPYVSVNVSPVQLPEQGFVDEVVALLEGTGLDPDKLQLEITEQAVLADEAASMDALSALRSLGVRLALDDFGTGYSSLAWLRRLPVHALKIDGSFIDGLRHEHPDPVDESIVGSLVAMAHALGLEVTAEWVETRVQADRLEALGCDLGQGRWFGDARPAGWVPADSPRTIG